jgi:hypothetical protein
MTVLPQFLLVRKGLRHSIVRWRDMRKKTMILSRPVAD